MKLLKRIIVVAGLTLFSLAASAQTIGVSIPAATHGWAGGLNFHAEQTKARLESAHPELKIVLVTANSASEQANDLEDLVAIHNMDALVILPFESAPLTGPVRNVKRRDVFVTVVDRGLSEEGIEDVYVAGNNAEMGRVSGEYIKEALNGSGDIVVLRGMPTVIDEQRFDGFMAAIEGSNINVLDHQYANWNRDDGFTVMQDFLSRFPKIDAVWAQDDDIAIGVIQAVRQARRQDDLFIVGGGGMKDIIRRVMEGDRLTPVDVLYPPSMISTAMELTALKFISDTPIEGEYILGSPLITEENAEQYYFPESPF
ncbi:MAG: ABC transporter substrate-binding protein [Gammaproteobacteria bacterium]|jgi:ribose transport system substrate-binding protein|nr:ABC transporter substrate-binding protein [Gammaproteobacteria bacterium]MBT3858550.1 ABC transporter substrate-binding protein [Gammaproteobacteria bacterium]MBT3986712.1 ABC transporter substrate-binding protein [Gammaproteobacteria bacterium]MBT4256369.1 ABC transporter substrate-binding protein [Gammaproteobacteria bacterium]MBT4582808.1 ABC transporter substrate-binding protein [Gammaproteobacteria bacterium]